MNVFDVYLRAVLPEVCGNRITSSCHLPRSWGRASVDCPDVAAADGLNAGKSKRLALLAAREEDHFVRYYGFGVEAGKPSASFSGEFLGHPLVQALSILRKLLVLPYDLAPSYQLRP